MRTGTVVQAPTTDGPRTTPVIPAPPPPGRTVVQDDGHGTVVIQTPGSDFPLPPPWVTLPPPVTLLIALGFFAAAALVLFPLMRAIARRIEGRPSLNAAELDELRARVADIETHQHRILEIEERLDFAERLLASRPDEAAVRRGIER